MRSHIIFIIVTCSLATIAVILCPDSVSIKKDITSLGQLLGTLLFIAIVIERASDIFLTTWRAEGSEKLNLEIEQIKIDMKRIESPNTDLTDEANKKLDDFHEKFHDLKKEQLRHSSKTRIYAFRTGLFLGIIISIIGFRFLTSLINPDSLDTFNSFQKNAFNFCDIILTGALLAGGSDGIHKVIDAYRTFMEKSSSSARER